MLLLLVIGLSEYMLLCTCTCTSIFRLIILLIFLLLRFITGGNFVDLINKGFYNDKVITRSDGFVIQTGDSDPAGSVHGYVEGGTERKVFVFVF